MSDQNTGSEVYNIVAFCFDGKDTAKETLKDAKSAGALEGYYIVAECLVNQNEKGKVHIHEPGHGTVGAVVGGVIGGTLGLIGGPAGVLALAASGAAIGGVAGHLARVVPREDLEAIGEALSPDTSAVLLLLEDIYAEDAINSMEGYSASVVKLTVGSELSGEIAQYAAGTVTDDEGNVVAGEFAAAADAEGNVVAGGYVAAANADGDVAAVAEVAAADADGDVVAAEEVAAAE